MANEVHKLARTVLAAHKPVQDFQRMNVMHSHSYLYEPLTYTHGISHQPMFIRMNPNKSSAGADMGDRLATIDMGQKVGGYCALSMGAGSPSNTISPGPRPTCVSSGILIHPTVWPQQTGQTEQRSHSIGLTITCNGCPKMKDRISY